MPIINTETGAVQATPKKINILQLGPLPSPEQVSISINDIELQVSKTIPYERVLDAIQWSIAFIMDDRPFISAPLRKIITEIAILKFWTNLDCDDIATVTFAPEELYEWYDILVAHNITTQVSEVIDAQQLAFFHETLNETLVSLVAFRNSAAGIVERLASNADKDTARLSEAMNTLQDDKQFEMLQKIMEMTQASE